MTIVRGTTSVYPAPAPRCHHCNRDDHLIADDGGPVVCFPCVELLTQAAKDPMAVSQQLRDWLAERHADLVWLGETDAGAQAWEWQGWS
jgi:hypothetical protein